MALQDSTTYDKCCRYVIDDNDMITRVDSNWNRFAKANHGEKVLADQVLGRRLWDFITGHETEMIYRQLVEKTRRERKTLFFPFRCDGLDCRRFMQMRISPLANGEVEFLSCIQTEEKRPAMRLLDPDVEHDDKLLVVCSWCKNVKCETEWLPVEQAVTKMALLEHSRLPMISHGMCPSCAESMNAELNMQNTA